jgi:hypothetical protein
MYMNVRINRHHWVTMDYMVRIVTHYYTQFIVISLIDFNWLLQPLVPTLRYLAVPSVPFLRTLMMMYDE